MTNKDNKKENKQIMIISFPTGVTRSLSIDKQRQFYLLAASRATRHRNNRKENSAPQQTLQKY